MATPKKVVKKKVVKKTVTEKVKGALLFRSNDKLIVRFDMDVKGSKIASSRAICFAADMIPPDFDRETHAISGAYEFTINIKEK